MMREWLKGGNWNSGGYGFIKFSEDPAVGRASSIRVNEAMD
jgi:hypothetical protein